MRIKPQIHSKYLQIAVTLNLFIVVILQIIHNVISEDTEERLPNIIFNNYIIVGIGKILAIYYHRLAMAKAVDYLRVIYPSKAIERKYQLGDYFKFYSRLEMVIWTFYRMVGPSFLLLPLFQSFINIWLRGKFSFILPLHMWGFDEANIGESSPWVLYILYYLLGGWCCLSVGMSITACDLLLYGMIIQLCQHFDLNSKQILELSPGNEMEALEQLKKIGIQHQKIMELAKEVNRIFGPSIIFSVMSSSFILCLVTYQMLDDVPYFTILKSFILLLYESKQVIITCYMGQKIMECSSLVNESLYMHNWVDGSVKYRRHVLIMLLCTAQPFVLYIGGIADITLVTLKVVYGNAYRLFTVFKST
uniref:Odorant receptor n=2 Tax=Stomoxys calcitrans TaxID=35570 RepID=A0A1I8Q8I8_STOCA